MAKFYVQTIVSEVVTRLVEVSDDFPGDIEREARYRASLGGGDVVEDSPANGEVVHLDWDTWEIEAVEEG